MNSQLIPAASAAVTSSSSSSSRRSNDALAQQQRLSLALNAALVSKQLELRLETSESIRAIREQIASSSSSSSSCSSSSSSSAARVVHSPFISHELESLIIESFIDQVYEEQGHQLQCASLRRLETQEVACLCFFRLCSQQEMRAWLKEDFASVMQKSNLDSLDSVSSQATLQEEEQEEEREEEEREEEFNPALLSEDAHDSLKHALQAQREYVQSLREKRSKQGLVPEAAMSSSSSFSSLTAASIVDTLSRDRWIKIELLTTQPSFRRQGLASLLCSCLLILSWISAPHARTHSILHVAGGSANEAAQRLYSKLGFTPVPSIYLNRPNQNVFVSFNAGPHLVQHWLNDAQHKQRKQHRKLLTSAEESATLLKDGEL